MAACLWKLVMRIRLCCGCTASTTTIVYRQNINYSMRVTGAFKDPLELAEYVQ